MNYMNYNADNPRGCQHYHKYNSYCTLMHVVLMLSSNCLFCKNWTYKKEKIMQNVSTIEAANTVRQSAEAKGDQDMLRLLLGINMDLVASSKYHKTCFASYVSKSNLKSRAFKDHSYTNYVKTKLDKNQRMINHSLKWLLNSGKD